MSDTDDSPVSRFSPAKGIYIDRTDTSIAISGQLEMFGPEATAARAQSVTASINSTWNSSFPDGYQVTCKIQVTYRGEGSSPGDAAQIEAVKIAGPSHVAMGDRSMTLNANETDAFTWTAAHEFGHVIGLQDRYSETVMSKLRGKFGYSRTNTVDPRYKTNLMGIRGGMLEAQNLRDLVNENSPDWLTQDDRVLDWILHHSLNDMAGLSTKQKVTMVKTMCEGWFSAEDLAALVRLCSSVTTRTEADAIRKSVDLLSFTSIGQRTRVRVAFAAMP